MHIPGSRSLKEKRRVVKGLIERMHSRFRVSVAETGFHDLRQRAEIGVAMVHTSRPELERLMAKLRDLAEATPDAMVTDWRPEVLEALP